MVQARLAAAVARAADRWIEAAVPPAGRPRTSRAVPAAAAVVVHALEPRHLLSAAFDLIGLTALRNDPAFDEIDGSGGTVVVVDTGVDFSHPLLSAAKVAERDFANDAPTQRIIDEHGTHVAGILGARSADIGVANGVGLIGLQVFSGTRGGDVSANDPDIEDALSWVLANRERYDIVAVNLSLGSGNHTSGGSARDSIFYDDVKRLEAAGVTVVSAAGNSYPRYERAGSSSPAVFSTLDVGAVYEADEGRVVGGAGSDYTTAPDRLTYFSQRPNTPNQVFAPGAYIRSTVPGGTTKELAGTSMAAPMVTGVVALMQEAAVTFGGRRLSTDEVRSIVRDTADPIVDGDDEDTSVDTTGNGYLRLDAYGAVRRVRDLFTGAGGGGGGGAELDPNGTIATAAAGPVLGSGADAAPIAAAVGADGTTNVGGDDVDLYRFTVNAPGAVTATVDTTAFRSVARVFDADGTPVRSATAAGNEPVALTVSLDPGTYYLGVSGAPNAGYDPAVAGSGPEGATGAYAVRLALDSSDPDGVISGAADINVAAGDTAQALDASIGRDGDRAVGGADVDFYRVTAPDDGALLIDVDTPDEPDHADTFVRVFDAGGNMVSSSDDDLAAGTIGQPAEVRAGATDRVTAVGGAFQGHATDSYVAQAVSKGAVYYVAVSNPDNRAFDPTSLAGRPAGGGTGAYSLFVGFRNGDVNGAIPQAVAVAELPADRNEGVIGTDGSPAGSIDVGDRDVDFIRLNAPTAGILKIDIDSHDGPGAVGDAAAVDTTVRLFDPQGELLAVVEGAPDGGPDPLLYYEVAAGGDHYLAVSGAGNDAFDPFLLGSGGQGDTGEYRFSAELLPASAAADLSDDAAADGGVQTLDVGRRVIGTIGDDAGFARGDADVDLYRFAAPYSAEFTFTAAPDDDFGADPYLRVFESDGTELAADDNGGGNGGAGKTVVRLAGGRTYLVGVSGAGPAAAEYDPVAGGGARGGSTGGYVVEATAAARTLVFDARRRATYTDADGSTVTVSLKGPGTGSIAFAGDGEADPNAAAIVLDGATDRTALTVKGDTAIGQVVVNGSIGAVTGKALDLTGSLTIAGAAKSVTLRNVTGSTMRIGTGGAGVTFAAAAVADSTLESGSPVRSLRVGSWADTGGGDDQVRAGSVAGVSARGDFAAGIVADSVGKVSVGGTLSGDVRSAGNIDAVSAGSIGGGASVFAGVAADTVGLPNSADDFANRLAVLGSITVRDTFAAAFVAAPTIRRAALGTVDAAAAAGTGGPFGLAADVVASATGSADGTRFRHRFLSEPAQSVTTGGAVIRVV